MEQSTIHIKAPHNVHIAIKVKATQSGISMNQYIVDLLSQDIGKQDLAIADVGIKHSRKTNHDLSKVDIEEVIQDLSKLPKNEPRKPCVVCGNITSRSGMCFSNPSHGK